jgi:hypothetical protein
MIAFQEHRFMLHATFNQQFDGSIRVRSSINVVSEENVDCAPRTYRGEIAVNYGEHLLEKIGASMNVAYRIDAKALRQNRLSRLIPRFRQSHHLPNLAAFSSSGVNRSNNCVQRT